MSVLLRKGEKINLNKESPGLQTIYVGLGWEMNSFDGADFDLDAEVFMVNEKNKVPYEDFFIFYHNFKSPDGSVVHHGDERKGGSTDETGNKLDDESIDVDLSRVSDEIKKLVFTVSIYDAERKRQNFGMMRNAYIRIVDAATQKELVRYDLSEDASKETAIIIGEIYRYNSEWRFGAVGQGFAGGLKPLAIYFGLDVE